MRFPQQQIVTPKIQSRDETEEIMKIFDLFDEDGTGEISFRNLKRVAVRTVAFRCRCIAPGFYRTATMGRSLVCGSYCFGRA